MAIEKIKRMATGVILFWVFFGTYLYTIVGYRDLFEYLGLLLIWLYVSIDIKGNWKYIVIILLLWNVTNELAVMFSTYWFNAFLLIPFYYLIADTFRINIYKMNLI